MRHACRSMLLLVALGLLGDGRIALASPPCGATYSHPALAPFVYASLVQAFVTCGQPVFRQVPNATTENGIPSCYPAETWNQAALSPHLGWLWGPKSHGTISLKAGTNKLFGASYPLNTDPHAGDLYVRVKMSDIRDDTGFADHSGRVYIFTRITLIDRADNQVMTMIDFPFSFPVTAAGGKISVKTSISARLAGLQLPALPSCTTVELLSVSVRDTNGTEFATLGAYLP